MIKPVLSFASILCLAGGLAAARPAAPKPAAARPAPPHPLAQQLRTAPAPAPGARPRPRLVVLISIDQFRADYIPRYNELYLPARSGNTVGGFRFLQTLGAWYPDCQYEHHRTVTGAGHSILGTGAQPYLSGIVGNEWWDRKTGKTVYCVDDPASRVVGGSGGRAMSPANLLVTTTADELELATGGRSRTVSVALKDRAAILMIGHRADTAIWFDDRAGNWISSSFYCRDGKLPAWVTALNAGHLADDLKKKAWTPSVDSDALQRVWRPEGGAVTFNHPLDGKGYSRLAASPAGNDLTLAAAERAVSAEQLGWDEIPDVLTINLSSNDYVGHRYGPDSPEVLDICVQTDHRLARFFNFLDRSVPGGLGAVTIALCADHGVATVPELNAASGVPARRAVFADIAAAADRALDRAIAPADWIASTANEELYFSEDALAQYRNEPRSRVENLVIEAVQSVPGVYWAYGRTSVLRGVAPSTAMGQRVARGVHPERSGDVIVILDPQWLPGSAPTGAGTSHGTPFTYDTHVALLMAGFGVRPGVYRQRVAPAQVAPTLSFLLGVNRPSAADEPLLPGLAGTD